MMKVNGGAMLLVVVTGWGCGSADGGPAEGDATSSEEPALEAPNSCGSPVERDLANFAVFVAEELRHWDVSREFELDPETGDLRLSDAGAERCLNGCERIRSMLALQRSEHPGGDRDGPAFRAALIGGWRAQSEADAQAGPLDDYSLSRIGSEPGGCGMMYWYDTRRLDCDECMYENTQALAQRLTFAGYPANPYLHFQTATDFAGHEGSLVGLDPTDGDNSSTADSHNLNGTCKRIRVNSRYLDAYTSGDGDVVTRTYQDNATQLWCFGIVGNNTFRIHHGAFTGQVLDAHESTNGYKAVLRDMQGNSSQSWKVESINGQPIFALTQLSSARVLTYLDSSEDDYRAVTTASHIRIWEIGDF